uniref:Putative orf73 protein n=1 Tax=Chondrus crispus TaxID=2769 RepID=Q36329_CHOCR|nr:orf73 [Chondrus crispus]CAA87598.1 putative orf73 [Chondrus crispus]
MSKEKIWPIMSSKRIDEKIKLKLIDKNIISSDINITRIFFWFKNIPSKLTKNNKDEIFVQFNCWNIFLIKFYL